MVALIHAASTWTMMGLIWFVQLVHYPLFNYVDPDRFRKYEQIHTRKTSWIVGPTMLVEAVTAVLLAWAPPGTTPLPAWIGLVLLAVIWASTALIQVPVHRRLSRGYDAVAVRRLVATNWVRTLAWSMRGVVALVLLEPV